MTAILPQRRCDDGADAPSFGCSEREVEGERFLLSKVCYHVAQSGAAGGRREREGRGGEGGGGEGFAGHEAGRGAAEVGPWRWRWRWS